LKKKKKIKQTGKWKLNVPLGKIVYLSYIHWSLSKEGYKWHNKNLFSRSPKINIMVRVLKSISVLKFLLEMNLGRFLLKVREKMATRKITCCYPQNFLNEYAM